MQSFQTDRFSFLSFRSEFVNPLWGTSLRRVWAINPSQLMFRIHQSIQTRFCQPLANKIRTLLPQIPSIHQDLKTTLNRMLTNIQTIPSLSPQLYRILRIIEDWVRYVIRTGRSVLTSSMSRLRESTLMSRTRLTAMLSSMITWTSTTSSTIPRDVHYSTVYTKSIWPRGLIVPSVISPTWWLPSTTSMPTQLASVITGPGGDLAWLSGKIASLHDRCTKRVI